LKSSRARVAQWIASAAGAGYIPFVPGTWGSIVGLLLDLIVRRLGSPSLQSGLHAGLIVGVLFLGVWASSVSEREVSRKDPSFVVIDEVAGMLLSTYFITLSLWGYAIAFVVFRALDVIKPPPCRWAEKLPSGWGIMMDDVFAGLYTNAFMRLLVFVSSVFGSV